MALIFKYKINKINIYPFGGYTIFENDINVPFITEFMVFLGGILFQILFFILTKNLIDNTSYVYKLIETYNLSILLFNMLPIVPLDGSKVINIIFNKLLPFKTSHLITIYISYVSIIVLIMYKHKNLNLILMIIMLLTLLIKEHKRHKYIFNAFLLERYIKDIKLKKNNLINKLDIKYMNKYKNNIFINNNRYISEKEMLSNKFN